VRDITEDAAGSARRARWSWQQIAERLGVTKQTVHRKHGKRTGRQS
jgi:IS30 family transposase